MSGQAFSVRGENGGWSVIGPAKVAVETHETNAAAWRAADRLNGEFANRQEQLSAWVLRKEAGTQ